MSSLNGHAAVVRPLPGLTTPRPRPETGSQSWDGPKPKQGRGVARMHERSCAVNVDSPLVKFARVWSQ